MANSSRDAGRAASGLFLSQAILAAINFPSSLILARVLGPTNFGEYQYYFRIGFLAVSVASLGYVHSLAWATTRAQSQSEVAFVYRHAVRVTLVQGLTVLAIGWSLVALGFGGGALWPALIVSAYPLFNMLAANLINCFRGTLEVAPIAGTRLSQGITWVGLIGILAATRNLTVAIAIGALVASQIVSVAWALTVASKRGKFRSPYPLGRIDSRNLSKDIRRFALKVFPGTTLRDWNVYLDQIVVGTVLGTTNLGYYAIGVSTTATLGLLSYPIVNTVQPVIQIAKREGSEEVTVAKALAATLLIVVPAALALAAFAPWLIPFLYGSAYRSSIVLVQILCVAVVLDIFNSCCYGILLGIGRPTLSSISIAAGLVANAIGWFVLLPTLGVLGAAITSVVAYATVAVLMLRAIAGHFDTSSTRLLHSAWSQRFNAMLTFRRTLLGYVKR